MAKATMLSSKSNAIFMARALLIFKFKLQKYHGLPDVLNEIQCF